MNLIQSLSIHSPGVSKRFVSTYTLRSNRLVASTGSPSSGSQSEPSGTAGAMKVMVWDASSVPSS